MEIFNKLNEEAQELVELFERQIAELSAEGNTKTVNALITLGQLMQTEVRILREETKLFPTLIQTCIEKHFKV
jgi:uncharacterized protein YegL